MSKLKGTNEGQNQLGALNSKEEKREGEVTIFPHYPEIYKSVGIIHGAPPLAIGPVVPICQKHAAGTDKDKQEKIWDMQVIGTGSTFHDVWKVALVVQGRQSLSSPKISGWLSPASADSHP